MIMDINQTPGDNEDVFLVKLPGLNAMVDVEQYQDLMLEYMNAVGYSFKAFIKGELGEDVLKDIRDPLMAALNEEGYAALFVGGYTQYFKQTSKKAISMPFVLLQGDCEGFQGVTREMGPEGRFYGALDEGVKVEFEKMYPGHPQIVKYQGTFSEKQGGIYVGEWRFKDGSDGDLKGTGRFWLKGI